MEPLVIERTYQAPIEKVWAALTDSDMIAKWFVPFSSFTPEPGCEFTFIGVSSDGKPKKHLCKVIDVIPHKKISYSWKYEGRAGDSLVTWELSSHGDGTTVKLTHAGLDTFPKEPGFARANFEQGWTHFTGALQALVESK